SAPSGKKLNDLVWEFGCDVFSTDGSVLFCKVCEKAVNFEKKYFVSQHVQTAKHQTAAQKTKPGSQQTSLLTTFSAPSSCKSTFSLDLCKTFVDAGIPLWKLEKKSLKLFLEKYTKQQIPSESTLRKNYVDTNYALALQRIRDEVQDKKIWISIRETTDVMGRFIANAPLRCDVFKEIAPQLALPPQPILTRWGTWISAVLYYASNLDKFQDIITSLDDKDSSAIHIVKELLQDRLLRNDLAFIASNYGNLPEAINTLEKSNMPLIDGLKCFETIVADITQVSGDKGKSVSEICERNDAEVGEMNPQIVVCFKYAPVTSVEVERSFSLFKNLLSDRRH
ncbi:CGG triplet repeat-binding protein 1-like 1, partial [Homarus americanus]